MQPYQAPGLRCPHCEAVHEVHTVLDATREAPQPGSLSICWKCRDIAVFAINAFGLVWLRKPSDAEQRMFDGHPQVRAALRSTIDAHTPVEAVRAHRRERRRR
jgi:hypothetical protein